MRNLHYQITAGEWGAEGRRGLKLHTLTDINPILHEGGGAKLPTKLVFMNGVYGVYE